MKNPSEGGTYLKESPESEAVFVSGTNREQTKEEKGKVEKILKPKSSKGSKEQ